MSMAGKRLINNMLDDATRYAILRLLEKNPELSQREIAERVGISLGKANYCVKALIDKGWIKIRNFRNSKNKAAYLYQLTPAGVRERAHVTRRFLILKMKEHEQLSADIERLRQDMRAQGE